MEYRQYDTSEKVMHSDNIFTIIKTTIVLFSQFVPENKKLVL